MSKYIYNKKIASKRDLHALQINQFGGLNTVMPQENVEDNQATYVRNFLPLHTKLRKRKGYEQVGKYKLNGIWKCYYNGDYVTIVHKGTSLYKVSNLNTYNANASNYTLIPITNNNITIANQKSFGIYNDGKLYLLCGSYIVIKFSMSNNTLVLTPCLVAEDTDTYVPTTTKGITGVDFYSERQRYINEAPNMLTKKRKNTVNTYRSEDAGHYYNDYMSNHTRYYELDSTHIGNAVSFTMRIVDSSGNVRTVTAAELPTTTGGFSINVAPRDLGLTTSQIEELGWGLSTYVTIGVIFGSGRLRLDYDFQNPNEDEDNVEIVFETNTSDAAIINGCTFGILFGVDGARNRLFVSGNPNYRNRDYHTASTAENNDDFTYFPVDGFAGYGTINSAILSYELMGNNELLVVKEKIDNEKSLYIRGAEWQTDD